MANHWYDDNRKLLKDDPTNPGLDWTNRERIACIKVNELMPNIVYDLGCGDCGVSRRIDDSIEYVGFDSVEHADGITIVDFNKEFPKIEKPGLAVCLGIFEYIDNLPKMIHDIYNSFDEVIFSCRDKDGRITLGLFKKKFKVEKISSTNGKPPGQAVYYARKK